MWLFLIFVLIMVIILSFLQSNKGKGIIGEFKVNRILKALAIKHGGIELSDFMLEDQLSSSQIDNMLITPKAIYVIETKNYRGMIFGSEENQDWTVTKKYVNKKRTRSGNTYKKTHIAKYKFYNPIKQNKTHIKKIKSLQSKFINSLPIYNIVVFGNNAILKDIKTTSQSHVVNMSKLRRLITFFEDNAENEIHHEQLIEVVDELIYANIVDKIRRRKHVSDLKSKYRT